MLPLEPLRGVNIGSWLIPEPAFLSPSTPLKPSLCEYAATVTPETADGAIYNNNHHRHNNSVRKARAWCFHVAGVMSDHLRRWISDAHFDWLAAHGINSLRLPLGWCVPITSRYSIRPFVCMAYL